MSETEIPADILAVAVRLSSYHGDSLVYEVAEALLDERRNSAAQQREKDARIAEKFRQTVPALGGHDASNQGFFDACTAIKAAIRGDGNG